MKKPLIILTGPTAVGKTDLSIQLARAVNGEIISADSMQIYKEMDIGSAKIHPDEMGGIRHYLVDEIEPEEEFHVVRFQQMAKEAINRIYEDGKIPIIVGGTGFYIQAVLYDIDFTDTTEDTAYRNELEQLALQHGNEYLHEMLRTVDPKAAEEIHANNRKRVIRALEYYREQKQPISKHNEEQRKKESPYEFAYFVLNRERSVLYERIDDRVDCMMKQGLLEEVERLARRGCTSDMVSMKGLGYKELLDYMNGKYSLEEAVRIIKRDTRHFAKRQITWFKRERDVNWIAMDKKTKQQALQEILDICREKRIL
ncbi:MAG: tRNA (adenosine(37)-N6)-dimethylallyltransferase MiaA [Clostridiales bacterium]|nr:tRNA (adenosine(37)-N6)-dimethylallyltransferase MiaA [Clostridiales bacterium]